MTDTLGHSWLGNGVSGLYMREEVSMEQMRQRELLDQYHEGKSRCGWCATLGFQ